MATSMPKTDLPNSVTKPVGQGVRTYSHFRIAMSLLEVFFGIMVLSVGILGSLSFMGTINDFRRTTEEETISHAIADQIAQQIKVSLTSNIQSWQEHRRATPVGSEADAIPHTEQTFIDAKVLSERSGLDNMEIYIEYYSDRLISEIARLTEAEPDLNARQLWQSAVGIPGAAAYGKPKIGPTLVIDGVPIKDVDPPIILPRDTTALGKILGETNSKPLSLIIRVLVSWRPINAPPNSRQWSEIIVAMRP